MKLRFGAPPGVSARVCHGGRVRDARTCFGSAQEGRQEGRTDCVFPHPVPWRRQGDVKIDPKREAKTFDFTRSTSTAGCARRSCCTSSSAPTRSSNVRASRSGRSSRTWCGPGGRTAVSTVALRTALIWHDEVMDDVCWRSLERSRSALRQGDVRRSRRRAARGLRGRAPRQPRLPAHARRADARHDLHRRRGEGRREFVRPVARATGPAASVRPDQRQRIGA